MKNVDHDLDILQVQLGAFFDSLEVEGSLQDRPLSKETRAGSPSGQGNCTNQHISGRRCFRDGDQGQS
eukprot:12890172-Prorocentrum_lima.AAC.1